MNKFLAGVNRIKRLEKKKKDQKIWDYGLSASRDSPFIQESWKLATHVLQNE